jgi:hypothetical protein
MFDGAPYGYQHPATVSGVTWRDIAMSINDDDISTLPADGTEGPADAGAGEPTDPHETDGGADGGAEGPEDAGAGDQVDPAEDDGGADHGA